MVARLNIIKPQCFTRYKIWRARSGWIALAVALVFLTYNAQSQDFLNGKNGTYKGPGLIQVKGQATGLPDTMTGTFEYFGGDQKIEAKNYENLLLTGNGTKNSTANNVTIIQSIEVTDSVKFQVDSSMILGKLYGRIKKENGPIIGRVSKTVDFTAPFDTSDFGGIGLTICSSGSLLGKTDVLRTTGSNITSSNGNVSIKRWYDVNPTNSIGLSGNLYFRYAKNELAGQDSTKLNMWRSPDGGVSWRRQRTSHSGDALVRSGKFLKGLWTAADPNHLLGLTNYEFDPDVIVATSSDVLDGKVKKPLDSLFTAKVIDIFGNPISGARVRFSIANPTGALGQVLSVISDTTNSLGEVSTRLTFGDRKGFYKVLAQVDSLPTAQVTFIGYAEPAAVALARVSSPKSDSIRTILTPLVVETQDEDSLAVGNVNVQFSIVKAPLGATMQAIVRADTTTDSTGRASAVLRLGEKVGEYVVVAHSSEIDGVVDTFRVNASPGRPAIVSKDNIVRQDTIGKILPQFTYTVTDYDTNAVPGRSVRFALIQPDSTIADSAIVSTNAFGQAKAILRLGDKAGNYIVRAEDIGWAGSERLFAITAKPGVPQKFDVLLGAVRQKEILSTLDSYLTVRMIDRANNPIQNDTVYFAITSTPLSSTGFSLSNYIAVTDADGYASTQLTLGDKIGTYTVQANSKNMSLIKKFNAIAIHGGVKTLAYEIGRDQVRPILTRLDTFVVKLRDVGGNPVEGKSVTFTIVDAPTGSSGSRLSQDTVVTDSLGEARTILTLGSKIGRYSVIARTPELPPDSIVRFYATATIGKATMLAQQSGNSQRGQLGDQIQPFVVQVKDAGGNLVPNTVVTFRIFGRPDSLTRNDSLIALGTAGNDSVVVPTDSTGLASASLILGSRPGRYTVKVSATGLRDTMFVAEAILLMADANHDNYRNIGDLTAMIDHAIGRKLLTGYAFLSADLYPRRAAGMAGDGFVDIRDIQYCLDSLLNGGWNPTCDWLKTQSTPLMKGEGGSGLFVSGSTFLTSKTDSCFVQTTYIGSRFSLKNSIPIKGLQAVIYMKSPANIDTTDIIFSRASMMRADVKSVGKEVTVLLWNLNNSPIPPGDSAIFRLPIQLSENNVDSIQILISSGSQNEVLLLNSVQKDIRSSIPRDWMLYQNYPNPFNPTTTIDFDVPEVTGRIPRAAIQIFNILGQRVRTIERGIHDARRYSVVWDGMNENGVRVASGVYFYRLLAGEYVSTKKMVMLK